MNSKHKNILFYICAVSFSLVNIIMILALFFHFVLGQSQENINWLIYGFAAEIVGCLVVGWHKIVTPDSKGVKPKNTKSKSAQIEIVNQGENSLAIEKRQETIDTNSKHTCLKKEGDALLKMARNKTYIKELREEYAQQSKNKYDQIPSNSPLFPDALYQKATADRVLGNYSESIEGYKRILVYVSEHESQYTETELRELKAEPTMMIGNVYVEKGWLDMAKRHFMDAWGINPDYMFAVYNLFEVAFISKKAEEARMWKEMLTRFDRYSEISKDVELKLNILENQVMSQIPAGTAISLV